MTTIKDQAYGSSFISKKTRFKRDYDAKRYSLRINGVSATRKNYSKTMTLNSRELIPEGTSSTMIAIFANTIGTVPEGSVSFKISINGGAEEEIRPVNQTYYTDTDVIFIRTNKGQAPIAGTKFIEESIRSAILTIKTTGDDPIKLSDIRVLREMEENHIV